MKPNPKTERIRCRLKVRMPTPEQNQERKEWRSGNRIGRKMFAFGLSRIILLRHTQELSYDEIAEVTNLPLGTVKNRLFRAREMMREIFIERGFTGF